MSTENETWRDASSAEVLPVLLPVILQRYPVILYPLIILFTTQHRRVLLLPESLP